jgi:hypothetical protein
MDNDVLGYILNEVSTPLHSPTIIKEKNSGVDSVIIECWLQDFETNRNRRFYTKQTLVSGLRDDSRISELIAKKSWFGESGHPADVDIKRQVRIEPTLTSHLILNYKIEDKGIKGIVETCMFPYGVALRDTIRQGVQVAFSMRGIGKVTKTESTRAIIDGNLRIITYDQVIYPSHASAYQEKILKESSTEFTVLNNDIANQCLTQAIHESVMEDLLKSDNYKIFEGMMEESPENINVINENCVKLNYQNDSMFLILEKDFRFKNYIDFINNF